MKKFREVKCREVESGPPIAVIIVVDHDHKYHKINFLSFYTLRFHVR